MRVAFDESKLSILFVAVPSLDLSERLTGEALRTYRNRVVEIERSSGATPEYVDGVAEGWWHSGPQRVSVRGGGVCVRAWWQPRCSGRLWPSSRSVLGPRHPATVNSFGSTKGWYVGGKCKPKALHWTAARLVIRCGRLRGLRPLADVVAHPARRHHPVV